MSEDKKKEEGLKNTKEFEKFVEETKKIKKVDTESIIREASTRERLERDYNEDIINVTFFTSPQTRRMVKAKRPTQKEMLAIMKLSAEAAIYEGKVDAKSLERMTSIYEQLPELAANLSLDKKLNTEFWTEKVSFATLSNFITELIKETQKGTDVSQEDLKSFR